MSRRFRRERNRAILTQASQFRRARMQYCAAADELIRLSSCTRSRGKTKQIKRAGIIQKDAARKK